MRVPLYQHVLHLQFIPWKSLQHTIIPQIQTNDGEIGYQAKGKINQLELITLQEINISHLGKRKIIFKYALSGGYVNSLGVSLECSIRHPSILHLPPPGVLWKAQTEPSSRSRWAVGNMHDIASKFQWGFFLLEICVYIYIYIFVASLVGEFLPGHRRYDSPFFSMGCITWDYQPKAAMFHKFCWKDVNSDINCIYYKIEKASWREKEMMEMYDVM